MKYLTLVAILITVNSCSYPEMIRDELVFSDNFESELIPPLMEELLVILTTQMCLEISIMMDLLFI